MILDWQTQSASGQLVQAGRTDQETLRLAVEQAQARFPQGREIGYIEVRLVARKENHG